MAVAGGAFTNSWDTTPNMTLIADNTWQCTQEITSAGGEFKFAANGTWEISWGGSVTVARVPGSGPTTPQTLANLNFSGLTPGLYQFTFNDETLEFQMDWAGASPLPLPSITNMALVGGFNSGTPSGNSILTNSIDNTNLWSGSVDLQTGTTFQFRPNEDENAQWGASTPTTYSSLPVTDANACGLSDFTLADISTNPGTFLFQLDTSNATFSITQTATQEFTISTMTAQGSFVATETPPTNMMQIGETLWQSEHYVTNSGTVTLRFAANDALRIWGATNGTSIALPVSGTMETGLTTYVEMTGVVPGRYRIQFDHQTGAFSFRELYTEASGINLLSNPGFEETTLPDGGDAVDWGTWQAWPKSVADTYLPHSGNWCGSIEGQWYPERTDYGSFAQDVPVTPGLNYRAAAWFKATPDWTASVMQIKIEWLNATNGPLGGTVIENIPSLSAAWVQYAAEGIAPEEATQAHVLFLCSGAGTTGSMQVDDAEMRSVASRSQNFDTWGELTDFATFAPDWSITSGKTVSNAPPPLPPAGVFISQYIEGTGNNKAIEIFNGTLSNLDLSAQNYVLQQYNNSSLTASVDIALSGTIASRDCLVIGRQDTPTNYAPDAAISDLDNLFTNKNLTFNGDDVIVLRQDGTIKDRVGQVSSKATGSLWSRNTTDHTLTRKSTIETGTVTSATEEFPLLDEWEISNQDTFTDLGSHEIHYEVYNPGGYSLIMDTGATLMSGELSGGIGDVSFWYRTESMTPAVTLVMETAISDSGPWSNVVTLTDSTSDFTYYVVAVNRSDHMWVRFRQTDAGTNRFRIDEITVTELSDVKRLEDFSGWTDPAYQTLGNYSRYSWSLQGKIAPTSGLYGTQAALITPPDGSVLSPAYALGVGELIFWTKSYDPEDPAYLLLQTSIDGGTNWFTQGSFTAGNATTYTTWLYLTNNPSQARIIFDPAKESGDTLLDSIEVRVPALYRDQDFDGWPLKRYYSSGTASHQGWGLSNCIVDAPYAYSGMAALLNQTTDGSAWIGSPYLPDGIGSISFRMRLTNSSSANISLQVQVSAKGVSWNTIDTFTATSSDSVQFQLYREDTTNHFVRFVHSAGGAAVPIDDIQIGSPQPRPEVSISPNTDPATPSTNDTVQITADIVTRYGASILSVTGHYKIASSLSFTPVAMTPVAYGSYASISSIPALPPSVTVQYYVTVQYTGIGAAPASTGFSTNLTPSLTNSYQISSVQQGDVWINEIAYLAYNVEFFEEDHEFIELCGVAGSDISGWSIELAFGADADIAANSNQPVYATYPISSHTFTNQTNGFSFYVLGDQQLLDAGEPIDEVLTVLVPPIAENWGFNHVADNRGVIRLLNEYGNLVYSISYAGSASGSESIPTKQLSYDTNSVNLGVEGSIYEQFTSWSLEGFSIGEINYGQTLIPTGSIELAMVWHIPSLLITPLNTNVVPPFTMLDPLGAQNHDSLGIHYGYSTTNYDFPNGTLYYRQSGYPSWSSLPMSIRQGSIDSNNDAYVAATIPIRAFTRGTTIEYVIQANPNETGISTAYIGLDTTNDFELFETLSEAQAMPFVFTYTIRSSIYITNMSTNATSWIFHTDGNDIIEPFVNFNVQVNTNALTQYRYIYDDDGNIIGLTTNSTWGTWADTTYTVTPIDAFGQNTFTVPRAGEDDTKSFYRINLLWP